MKRQSNYALRTILVIVTAAFILIPFVASTQETKPVEAALTGTKILDNYVEATGGVKAYESIKNQFLKSTMTMSVGVVLDVTAYMALPNLYYSLAKSKEIGEMEQGYDGQICWEKSLAGGPRIIEGAELQDMLRDNIAMDRTNNWRNYYDSAVLAGADSVNGAMCYKVVVYPKNDKSQTFYFDQKSSLLIRIEATYDSQMGSIPLDSYLSDYKKIGDILIPHKTIVKFMGQDQVMTLDSMAYNVEISPDLFKVPEDIKALIKTDKK
jgi:zinc protease